MKIVKVILLSYLFLLSAHSLLAQDESQNWEGKIVLDGEEMKKEIKVEVSPDSEEISVSIDGKVSGGNLKVKLYNPRGIRVANLNLCAGRGGTAKGRMEEAMDASPGIWVLKVQNDEAKGKVNIEVKQN